MPIANKDNEAGDRGNRFGTTQSASTNTYRSGSLYKGGEEK